MIIIVYTGIRISLFNICCKELRKNPENPILGNSEFEGTHSPVSAFREWWVFNAALLCPTVARAVFRNCVWVRSPEEQRSTEVPTDCWTGTQLSQLSACQIWRPNFESCFPRLCSSGNSACQTVAGMFPGSTASGWQLCATGVQNQCFPSPPPYAPLLAVVVALLRALLYSLSSVWRFVKSFGVQFNWSKTIQYSALIIFFPYVMITKKWNKDNK